MENNKINTAKYSSTFAVVMILGSILIGILCYNFILGDASHFLENGDPVPGDYYGIMYKGGPIVPFLMSFFVMIFATSIERGITLLKAKGKKSLPQFVYDIKNLLAQNNVQDAILLAKEQEGSVGNVVFEVLNRYEKLANDGSLTKEARLDSLQKEIEEATMLELPALEKNLVIIATLASVSTLVALLGTVIGMIKAFAALSTSGTPDPSALATGISEALVNTALGIFSSALAIIIYNFFTSKVDAITQTIDEVGFSIRHMFLNNVK